jgi:hypothetical protein
MTIAFCIEMAILELERNKSPSIDGIPTEFIQKDCSKLLSGIHKLINSNLTSLWAPFILLSYCLESYQK